MKKIKQILVICFMFLFLSNCQVVKEVHYFRSGENYYRLNVKASAVASKSRYIAGYFDENAVDNYFSELSKNDTVSFIQKNSKVNGKEKSESIVGKGNTKLVMILSTNSDIVSDQIGNLAQNEVTLELLARLANKDKIEENKKLNESLSDIFSQNNAIISTGDIYIKSLGNKDTTDINLLLNYLNYVSTLKGYGSYFETVDDALRFVK